MGRQNVIMMMLNKDCKPKSMEAIFYWFLLSLVATIFTIVILKKLIATPNKPKTPPGPKPWPIIGNLNLMGAIPHLSLHILSQKYGGLMQMKFGSTPIIIVSTPEFAKVFLKTVDHLFVSRPQIAAGKYTGYNFTNLTWAPYGTYWHQARRIYANELLSTRKLDKYEYLRVEQKHIFLSQLYTLVGKPIVLREHLLRYTLRSISRQALGKNYFTEDKSDDSSVTNLDKLIEVLEEWFYLNGVFNIGDWIPWLNFLDLQGYLKRMKAFPKKIDKFNTFVVNDHKARRELAGSDFVPKDIVDVLLQHTDESNLEAKLTNDNVKGLMQDVIAGGTDTTATTVEWAMSELLKHPHLLEKATEELDRVIGKERWVEEKDSTLLPFIEAIVKETVRLHPAATFLAPHMAIEDCDVLDYHITKGTIVFVNVYSLGRDPSSWDSPEEFRPERFLGKSIDERGQHYELIPFGSGRRMCPGFRLGMKMIRSTLANIIHGFNWTLPDNMNPSDVDMEEDYGLTTHRKTPIVAVMKHRLAPHMYQMGTENKTSH